MMQWLKNKIRKWLQVEVPPSEKPLNFILSVCHRTGGGMWRKEYKVTGAMGLCLTGEPIGPGSGMRLLFESEAVDPEQFHDLWRYFSPLKGVKWEDGSPVRM